MWNDIEVTGCESCDEEPQVFSRCEPAYEKLKADFYKLVDDIQTDAIEYDDVIVYPGWSVGDVLKMIEEILNRKDE